MSTEGQLDTVQMMVNMGPQHPSTHGVFRMVLTIDGERIVDMEPHIGYLHRGSEKLCEGEQYAQVITLFDRLDYISNFNNELVYCRAVEKLMGQEVPERAEYVRVILCELNRIASHLLFVGTFGLDTGAMTPVMFTFRGRERIQSVFEAISGARMMPNYFRVGGIKEDLPDNFEQLMADLLPLIEEDITESDKLLTFNEIFLVRLKDVGVISADDAIDFGLTGPCLRASGVNYDLRKAAPYSLYDRFDFDKTATERVPVREARPFQVPGLRGPGRPGHRPADLQQPRPVRAREAAVGGATREVNQKRGPVFVKHDAGGAKTGEPRGHPPASCPG